ncbi:hypothetical protein H6F67_17195 [Microcoleus sp. FACHB-1515]|uniref:tetratricopeptide repeat protein n=1 Tax=Cyanophyceae TaxID=3028117 RepID=UPI0016894961|nr:hypothetical protein [Microcoleus sp. FACHB-1515]MBD2091582.1 hypothetical protein [Microcoleus sp. FACHB-1515]
MISAGWFKTLAAIVCLSTLSPSALAVQIAQAPISIAQTTIDCSAERRDIPLAAVSEQIERTRQLVNDRQTDAAVRSLTETIQAIGRLQDVSIKVSLLDGLVNSIPANPSLLEQLVTQTPPEQRPRIAAVLSQATQIAQSFNTGYSAAKTRTLTSIARYYATIEQRQQSQAVLTQALQASRSIRGADFQAPALIAIAQGYVLINQPQTAAPLLGQALPLAQSIANANRKAIALEQIASLYTQINQIDRALQIARSIAAPYYQALATQAIIDRYLGANQIDRALELLQALPQTEQKALMLAAIAGRLEAQQPQRASQLYAQAVAAARSTSAPNEVSGRVAQRYVESGGLVATADETILAISDPIVKAPALGSIALFYARAGQEALSETRLRQAIDLLASIPDEISRNNARQQLIDRAVLNGRYDYALRVAQTIQPGEEFPFDRVDVLVPIALDAARGNNPTAALQIVEQIPPSFVDWRDRVFLEIARAYARGEDFDRAVQIAQRASNGTAVQPRILAQVATIIHQMGYSGYPERAAQIFAQALQTANRLEDATAKADAIAAIAIEYNRIGQTQRGSELITQAIATAQTIQDPVSRSAALRTISEYLTAANQYQAAILVAEAIPDESERLWKLNETIEKAVNANEFAAVLPAVNRLNNPVPKTRWLIAIADRYAQQGQPQRAIELLNQALQSARTVPGDESQTIVVRGGENRLVVDDDQDRGSFYEAIALRFARLNQTGRALEVARSIQNAQARQQLTQRIGCYR